LENSLAAVDVEGGIGKNAVQLGAAIGGVKLLDLLAHLLFLARFPCELEKRSGIPAR
jgi:hypothetical protein